MNGKRSGGKRRCGPLDGAGTLTQMAGLLSQNTNLLNGILTGLWTDPGA